VLRKAAATALTAGLVLVATTGMGAQRVGAAGQNSNLDRAIASYNAMQQYFYKGDGSNLYNEHYPAAQPGDNTYSYEWPFSQATNGTIDLANADSTYLPAVQDRLTGLAHYYSANGLTPNKGITTTVLQPSPPGYDSYVDPPLGGSGDKFYDDNEWVGLASIQLYQMTGDQSALDRAETIFTLITKGWDYDTSHPAPGGVFWTQAPWSQDRNTVSNMPGAELGLYLYQATHDASYRQWAQKMYDWVNTNLRDPSDGLYWDHISLSGKIDQTKWSYNQGTPIGTNVLFYQITGNQAYLRQAESIANAALAYLGANNDKLLHAQDPIFDAIFFKNLLMLYAVDHNPAYVQAMQDFADWAWSTARDPSTGVFTFPSRQSSDLNDQAAMVRIYAMLAVLPPTGGGTVPTGGGAATPELGSGELLATGLVPIAAVLLYRRRRARRGGV